MSFGSSGGVGSSSTTEFAEFAKLGSFIRLMLSEQLITLLVPAKLLMKDDAQPTNSVCSKTPHYFWGTGFDSSR
jgi:hypothetical protein